MQTTPHTPTPNRVGRIAVVATGLFTAFLVALAIIGGSLDAIGIMAPFWLLTLLVGAATYAAGAYLASRTDSTHITIDLTADDRVTSTV